MRRQAQQFTALAQSWYIVLLAYAAMLKREVYAVTGVPRSCKQRCGEDWEWRATRITPLELLDLSGARHKDTAPSLVHALSLARPSLRARKCAVHCGERGGQTSCSGPGDAGTASCTGCVCNPAEGRWPARRAGLARPHVEVRWEDLSVEAAVLVGQRARPTVLSFYRDALLVRAPLGLRDLARAGRAARAAHSKAASTWTRCWCASPPAALRWRRSVRLAPGVCKCALVPPMRALSNFDKSDAWIAYGCRPAARRACAAVHPRLLRRPPGDRAVLEVRAVMEAARRTEPLIYNLNTLRVQAPLVAAGLVRDARVTLRILERCSGRLEPGRLTLLLGAPASGKSTLLHALAGALHGGALKVGLGLGILPRSKGCHALAGALHGGALKVGSGTKVVPCSKGRHLCEQAGTQAASLAECSTYVCWAHPHLRCPCLLFQPVRGRSACRRIPSECDCMPLTCDRQAGKVDLLLLSGVGSSMQRHATLLCNPIVQVRGRVTYNGRALGEFQARRTAALVEQRDMHVAQLTVRETLDFAARCQGTGNRAGARRSCTGWACLLQPVCMWQHVHAASRTTRGHRAY